MTFTFTITIWQLFALLVAFYTFDYIGRYYGGRIWAHWTAKRRANRIRKAQRI